MQGRVLWDIHIICELSSGSYLYAGNGPLGIDVLLIISFGAFNAKSPSSNLEAKIQ